MLEYIQVQNTNVCCEYYIIYFIKRYKSNLLQLKQQYNKIHTGCKYVSMFTEFTVFLFAILEPLHQASKQKSSTSISALINIQIKVQ